MEGIDASRPTRFYHRGHAMNRPTDRCIRQNTDDELTGRSSYERGSFSESRPPTR